MRTSALASIVCLAAGCLTENAKSPSIGSGDIASASAPPPTKAGVRNNQLGFFPRAPKRAIANVASASFASWELVDDGGAVVLRGVTKPFGQDAASGDLVHVVDFSSFTKPGRYRVKVGTELGPRFEIAPRVFQKLKYDALAFFYHQRSGVPIIMPYAGDPRWTRPAGHLGDAKVGCASGCDYTLDVHGGWYDAGDQGKYVVNGGIAAWTLLNAYERAKRVGTADEFGDGKMAIPENANGAPDLLDEARFEIEFLLRMQAPSGMAHHKIHDEKWTKLPTAPHEDKEARYLHPPSTAATLNLAAVAAQCARVYDAIDRAFAARCLKAAERAWAAALANPSRLASAKDDTGGGPYDDNDVSDEFYWAAAELFVTTGDARYQGALAKSQDYLSPPEPMTWQDTAALGTISLAGRGNEGAKKAIVAAADALLARIASEGYRVPIKRYVWGSNSFVLNSAIVLALAHDTTGDQRYLEGVVDAMDYVLGRNPLGQSYVTGYGEKPLRHPHHRFWADQKDPRFPPPPPGALSGGPNADLQDPRAKALVPAGSPPERCFADDMESYSTNEVAINWNAPLAWVAAFLDEKR